MSDIFAKEIRLKKCSFRDKMINSRTTLIDKITVIIAIFIIAFYPTSVGGQIKGSDSAIVCWLLVLALIIILALRNSYNYVKLCTGDLFFVIYMLIVTLLAQTLFTGCRMSIARIAPVMAFVLFTNLSFRRVPPKQFMGKCLTVFSTIIVVWNALMLFGNEAVKQFTLNNFSQYYQSALYTAIYFNNKPVMTFGVHTYASFYYFLLFILHFFTYEYDKKKLHVFFMLIFTAFTILLFSTTSLIYSMFMIGIFIAKFSKRTKLEFIMAIIVVIVGAILISANINILYEKYIANLTSINNGFNSRYLNQSLFKNNIKVITSSLGIGFNIVDSLEIGYSDSGYILYLTMGSLPMAFYMYYSLWKYIRYNIPSKYFKIISVILFSFEVALPASFNYRYVPTLAFLALYCKSIIENNDSYTVLEGDIKA